MDLSLLALVLSLSGSLWVQSPAHRRIFEDTRCTSGRVVLEGSRSPIKGAKVEPHGIGIDKLAAETDASGAFQVSGGPRCAQTTSSYNLGIDYLRVSTPDGGVAHVDTCASAPWSDPIDCDLGRASSGSSRELAPTLVNAVVPASEVNWPPQSGLASTDERARLHRWTACSASESSSGFQ
jgi:hypothetical protein